jgi:hypothetical protein
LLLLLLLLFAVAAIAVQQASPFERMQWGVLNSAVSLCGYFAAAAVVDNPR